MPTFEEVKKEFERRDCVLLSEEYKNLKTKLDYICDKGHNCSILFGNFKKAKTKTSCKTCFTSENHYDYSKVKKIFEDKGYKLISTEYIDCFLKLDCICPNNHNISISFSNFHNKNIRCKLCNSKYTIDSVKQIFKNEGYELLETEYINNRTQMKYTCPNNHQGTISIDSFVTRNRRCPQCTNKYNIDSVKQIFKNEGYKLLENVYVNNKTQMKYICPNNHQGSISLDSFSTRKRRCPQCKSMNKFK